MERRDFYVYLYRDRDGVPVYVGQGHGRRDARHKTECKSGNSPFHQWLRGAIKRGEPIGIYRLQEGLTREEALAAEAAAVARYGRRNVDNGGTLLNVVPGGVPMEIYRHSNGFKRRMDETRNNAQHRERLSAATKESNGRPHRREQQRALAIEKWADPANREVARKRAKELWADPVWAAARRAELVARNKAGRGAQ